MPNGAATVGLQIGAGLSAEFNQPKPDPMLNSMVWADLGARYATLRV